MKKTDAILMLSVVGLFTAIYFSFHKPESAPPESESTQAQPAKPEKQVPWGYVCAALSEGEAPPKCMEWKTVFKGAR